MSRSCLPLSALALAWALAACSQLPPYERPPPAVPAAYPDERASATGTRPPASTNWREFIADARLRALITHALDSNRDLRVATLRIEEARARYGLAQADRLPGLAAQADASFRRGGGAAGASGGAGAGVAGASGSGSVGASGGSDRRSYSVSVAVLSYELDFWGRLRSLEEAARARFLQTTQARSAFQLGLVADVAETYLAGEALAERIALTQTVLRTREASLRLARLRLAEGEGSRLEVQQELTLIAQARAQLADLASQAARNRNLLDLLTGHPSEADLPPARPLSADPWAGELLAGLPSDLLARRPDVLAAEQALLAANADVGAARAAFFPRISLTGALGLASTQLDRLLDDGTFFASASPSLLASLFDGGRNRANEQLSLARRDIAVAQYQRAVQVAFREVADALAARRHFAEQLRARQDERLAQAERLRLAELRFREGEADSLEVLDARRELFAVEQSLVELRRAVLANAITLYAALGGGAEQWNAEPGG